MRQGTTLQDQIFLLQHRSMPQKRYRQRDMEDLTLNKIHMINLSSYDAVWQITQAYRLLIVQLFQIGGF